MSTSPRIYHYEINEAGELLFEDKVIDDPSVLKLFFKTLTELKDGRYLVHCMGEENYITAADCPYVIHTWEKTQEGFKINMQADIQEYLDLEHLETAQNNVLYTRVRDGKFKARFSRQAYLDFCKEIKSNTEHTKFYIELNRKKYFIKRHEDQIH